MGKSKTKWTDIVQAIASIVAIIAAIIGFYTLYSDDIDMQKQIDNLTTLAKESSEQSRIMREELEISRTRNTILIKQIGLDQEKWIKQNRPDLVLDLTHFENSTEFEETIKYEGLSMINNGGALILEGVEENKGNNCKISIPNTFIPNQGRAKFEVSIPKNSEIFMDINILFRDIDGNKYFQRFISNRIKSDNLTLSDITPLILMKSEKPERIKD